MSEANHTTKKFRTDVLGIGPYCVEFSDGEIVSTRSQERQNLIANAERLQDENDALLASKKELLKILNEASKWMLNISNFPEGSTSWHDCYGVRQRVDDALLQIEVTD